MASPRPVETDCFVEAPVLVLGSGYPVVADSSLPEDAVAACCLVHRSSADPGDSDSDPPTVLAEVRSIQTEAGSGRPKLVWASDSMPLLRPLEH